jgi:hypothetical protein
MPHYHFGVLLLLLTLSECAMVSIALWLRRRRGYLGPACLLSGV